MGKVYTKPGGGSSDLSFVTAAAGDIVSGKVGANADGEPVNGSLSLSGNAATSDVASGKTFYTTNPKSKQTGTLVDRGQYQMAGGWGSGGSGSDAYFAMNAIPEGIYRSNGANWAPEIRMKQSDVRAAIGATNAANWRSNTTIAGLKGTMPEQGGKTVTPTGSTQTVVSGGRYVTGDIKVAGVSGLPDVRPNLTVKINEDDVSKWYGISSTVGLNIITGTELDNYLSYTKLMFKVKLRFKNAGLKDLGYMYVSLGKTSQYYITTSLKYLYVKISDGTILDSLSGLTAREFAHVAFNIQYYKASTSNIISAAASVDKDKITEKMPYYMELTLVGAWK